MAVRTSNRKSIAQVVSGMAGGKPKQPKQSPTLRPPLGGGTISTPTGVATGYGVGYDASGKPISLGALNQQSPYSSVGLGPGVAVQYDASGKPIGFVNVNQQTGAIKPPAAGGSSSDSGASGPPNDPDYDAQIAALAKQRDAIKSGLGGQRVQGLLDYGYLEDASGNLSFDPNNPFSRAALLLRNYQQSSRGATTSMAASGQLYSGALQRQQENQAFNFNTSDDAMKKALAQFLAGNTAAAGQADIDYDLAAAAAGGARTQRATGR